MHDDHHEGAAGHSSDPDVELTVSGILYTAFGILAVTAVSMVLMWLLGTRFESAEESTRRALTPLEERALAETRRANEAVEWEPPLPGLERNLDLPVPPGPNLELVEGYSMRRMREEESARLNHYGYLDEGAGRIHIPVDRAIEMALERAAETPKTPVVPMSQEVDEGSEDAVGDDSAPADSEPLADGGQGVANG
ncbi:MAG: hypothetical protein AAF481_10040 [Acidobacteriota bacterium]